MANSVDPEQTPRSVASDQGLHSLLKTVCPIIWVITIYTCTGIPEHNVSVTVAVLIILCFVFDNRHPTAPDSTSLSVSGL